MKKIMYSRKDSKDNYKRCLIMLNSNIEVPDVYEFKSDFEGAKYRL